MTFVTFFDVYHYYSQVLCCPIFASSQCGSFSLNNLARDRIIYKYHTSYKHLSYVEHGSHMHPPKGSGSQPYDRLFCVESCYDFLATNDIRQLLHHYHHNLHAFLEIPKIPPNLYGGLHDEFAALGLNNSKDTDRKSVV